MIKDLLVSFKDNIKAKSTNPFFGTLIIVWTVRNWNLFYSLFNFDDDFKLGDKISFIINHFTSKPFWPNLVWCIFYSFAVLTCSYILINVSRLIINFFEKIVTPIVYKITDKSSIVLKTEFDSIMAKNKKLEERLEEERSNRIRQQNEYEDLEKRYYEVLNAKRAPTNVKAEIKTSKTSAPSKAQKTYEMLEKENLLDTYNKLCSEILNKVGLPGDDHTVKKFVTMGLFVKQTHVGSGKYHYTLSNIGAEVHDMVLLK